MLEVFKLIVFKLKMKKIKLLLIIVCFSKGIYAQHILNNVTFSCLKISKFEFLLIVKNNEKASIYMANSPYIHEGTDTLWIDNRFSFTNFGYERYFYKILDTIYETNQLIPALSSPDTIIHDSEPMPNYNSFGELIEIKPNETVIKKITVGIRDAVPSKAYLRIFSKSMEKSDRNNYDLYEKQFSSLMHSEVIESVQTNHTEIFKYILKKKRKRK